METMPNGGKDGGRRKPQTKRRALGKDIREEEDPQWKAWFSEIERRKKVLSSPKGKFVRVEYDKDGKRATIDRWKSIPVPIKSFLKKSQKKAGESLNADLLLIAASWKRAVAGDIADNSSVYSFKTGVLTISVNSSSLLQEIRQFHKEAILADLRDIWPASQPLVKINYRLGKQ